MLIKKIQITKLPTDRWHHLEHPCAIRFFFFVKKDISSETKAASFIDKTRQKSAINSTSPTHNIDWIKDTTLKKKNSLDFPAVLGQAAESTVLLREMELKMAE